MPVSHLSSKKHSGHRIEGPTLAVAGTIYAGWLGVTHWHALIPTPLLALAAGWLLAWHGSLQHETIHGHPTGVRLIDDAIGFLPLSLWLPYRLYRSSHLAHHASEAITDPSKDPESRYVDRLGGLRWMAARLQSTLLGHMLLGPPFTIARFIAREGKRVSSRPLEVARDWVPHLVAVALILLWLDHIGLSLVRYVLVCIYPGMALTNLRSYAEHRADLATTGHAATVERGGVFALLFLNNNLHAAHHERPGLAWYRLPFHHRQHRARLVGSGVSLYSGYGEIARRFLLRTHDKVLHPRYRDRTA